MLNQMNIMPAKSSWQTGVYDDTTSFKQSYNQLKDEQLTNILCMQTINALVLACIAQMFQYGEMNSGNLVV